MSTRTVQRIARELATHADLKPNWFRREIRCKCGVVLDQWAEGAPAPHRDDIDAIHQEHTAEFIAAALAVPA